MPRRSAEDARATKTAIVGRAVDVASLEGLEGLTIGRLAGDLGMSKAGVIGHFGSKELLQLAAVEAAGETFTREVWMPARDERPGLRRLLAICDAWIDHISSGSFPGGCFWTGASTEFDGRAGPVRDAIASGLAQWHDRLKREASIAIDNGELPPDPDAAQIGFELRSIAMGLNQELQLHGDPSAPDHARRAVRRVLGLPAGARPAKLGV